MKTPVISWSINNKLSIHYGNDQFKSIRFATNFKMKKVRKLNIKYGDIHMKQHSKVKYLDETMSGETITVSVINKSNNISEKHIFNSNSEGIALKCSDSIAF